MYMWARLLLVVSLFAECREMVEGGNITKKYLVGPWALVGWAFMGRALMGRALMGVPGPLWAGPLWVL